MQRAVRLSTHQTVSGASTGRNTRNNNLQKAKFIHISLFTESWLCALILVSFLSTRSQRVNSASSISYYYRRIVNESVINIRNL